MSVLHATHYLHLCKYVLYKVEKVLSTGISIGVEDANTPAMGFQ